MNLNKFATEPMTDIDRVRIENRLKSLISEFTNPSNQKQKILISLTLFLIFLILPSKIRSYSDTLIFRFLFGILIFFVTFWWDKKEFQSKKTKIQSALNSKTKEVGVFKFLHHKTYRGKTTIDFGLDYLLMTDFEFEVAKQLDLKFRDLILVEKAENGFIFNIEKITDHHP